MTASLSTSPLASAQLSFAHHDYGPFGGGFGWLVLLIPLFWVGLIVLIAVLFGRRWRRAAMGPGGRAWHSSPITGAEASLAERFAQGDIDETEYRSRLEVLRASRPQPQK
ncbi:MAG: hypothetical protein H7146_02345 [Burkholderiaceae bacterium]|nr:hypothetical protein [Microbacteriaceae bacterium]